MAGITPRMVTDKCIISDIFAYPTREIFVIAKGHKILVWRLLHCDY